MSISIRDAGPDDADTLAVLLDELGYPASPAAARERLAAITNAAASRALVAVAASPDGDEVVGLAVVHVLPSLEHPGCWARLAVLVVSSRHRRGGVGSTLVAAVQRHARDAGATIVEVTSATRRTRAHEFYARLGFEEVNDRSKRFVRFLVSPAEWA